MFVLLTGWATRYLDANFVPPPGQDADSLVIKVKQGLEELIAAECEACVGNRVLVVLDDVWDNGLMAARKLQAACPGGATVLLTTRSTNLAHDLKAHRYDLNKLGPAQGEALLREYFKADESLSGLERAILQELSQALGGHALALALAARRVLKKPQHRRKALADQLAEYQQKLPLGQFAALKLDQGEQREDSLSLVLSYSYDELDEAAQARFRAVGDRGGEAATLNNIGLVYADLGQKAKALDTLKRLCPSEGRWETALGRL